LFQKPTLKHEDSAVSTFFDELLESVQQMDEIVKGERTPSREFHVDALAVKEIRKITGPTQQLFAQRIGIEVATLRNWEQGRREPTGPAKALLTALKNDPEHVMQALEG
jgi:putative transcriptional regulator